MRTIASSIRRLTAVFALGAACSATDDAPGQSARPHVDLPWSRE